MMETLSTYMQPFFDWLLRSTFQASIVVCLILLIQGVLRSRLTARWHYALWLILVVRMVLPWTPQSRFSIFNLTTWQSKPKASTNVVSEPDVESSGSVRESSATQHTTPGQERSIKEDGTAIATTSDVSSRPLGARPELTSSGERQDRTLTASTGTQQESADPATRLAFRLSGVLPFLWLTGAILLGGYIIICNLKLWRAASIECPSTDKEILELLEECRSKIGLRTIVTLIPSTKVNTPVLLGFIRPRLLVPTNITKGLTREELRYVLLHELAHVKRHDIALGWLTALLQVLHWFNPLVWLAFHQMRSSRESACDALVLSRTQGEGTQDYGRAIVSLLEHFSVPQPLPGLAGILESKSQLKRRIAMITQFTDNSYRFSALGTAVMIALVCISMPDAKRDAAFGSSVTQDRPGMTLRRIKEGRCTRHSTVSPDGRYICDVELDWDGTSGKLVILDLSSGEQHMIKATKGAPLQSRPMFPAISPDNRAIAYEAEDFKREVFELCLIGFDGSRQRVLGQDIWPMSWSADGKHILGHTRIVGEGQTTIIWTSSIVWVSVEDGSVQKIMSCDDGYGGFSVSPDGRYIAYHRPQEEGSSKHDVFVLDMMEDREAPLVQNPAGEKLLGWAPDGKHILFASDRLGSWDAWLLPVDKGRPLGEPELITRNLGDVESKTFAKNGSFYYQRHFWVENVYTATIDLQAGQVLSPPTRLETAGISGFADWSPDGKYLAYCCWFAEPQKPRSIRIRSLATGQEREIPHKFQMIRCLRWSPDGRSLLASQLSGDKESFARVYRFDADTGNSEILYQAEEGGVGCAESSQDGKVLFCSTVSGNSAAIIRRDIESRKETRIFEFPETWDSSINSAVSPDDKLVAVSFDNREPDGRLVKKVAVVSSAGGPVTELLRWDWDQYPDCLISSVVWTPDSKHILFTLAMPPIIQLWAIAIDDPQPRKIMEANLGNWCFSLRIHPDGQRIAIHAMRSLSEMWEMSNFLPESTAGK